MDTAPLVLSLKVALTATAVDVVLGVGLAWALAYGRFRAKNVLDIVVNVPVALPPTVLGYYLLVLLGRSGPVGFVVSRLGGGTLIFTPTAAVVAAAVVALPLVVQAVRIALENVPEEAMEAACVDGAGRWQVLWHIIVPQAMSGIGSGAVLGFARALGEFGATLMVAGNIPGKTQTVPNAIFTAVQAGRMQEANWLSLILLAVAGLSIWVWRRLGQLGPGFGTVRRAPVAGRRPAGPRIRPRPVELSAGAMGPGREPSA